MVKGEKKDAKFIAERFIPHIQSLDPKGEISDIVYFDGASNVQKGGLILEQHFPRMKCLKGVEHCVALFFRDVAQIPVIKDTILRQNRLYLVFSSGIFHSAYSNFKNQTCSFNGRPLGLLRATEVRMAGHFYAMMRSLRCRTSLRATVTHFTWEKRKKKTAKELRAAQDVMDDKLFVRFYLCGKMFLHALVILRLADGNGPGMDMLKYYMTEFQKSLSSHQRLMEDKSIFPMGVFEVDKQLEEDQDYNGSELSDEEEDDDTDDEQGNHSTVVGKQSFPVLQSIKCLPSTSNSDDEQQVHDQPVDEDSSVSSSDSNTDSPRKPVPHQIYTQSFFGRVHKLWYKREADINSDFATTAWICCVVPAVRDQVREYFCLELPVVQEERRAMIKIMRDKVNRTIRKLYTNLELPKLIERKVSSFWDEWSTFQLKMKPFQKQEIWESQYAVPGKSHIWHKNYSLYETEALGFVACRTTSKPLGIGPAERSWGDVKYLKSGKRSNLATNRLEKQAVCYTHSCLERARIYRDGKDQCEERKRDAYYGWEDRDKQFELDVKGWNLKSKSW
jgi:hypothetical protein